MPRQQYDSRVDRKPFMDKISNNIHMPPPKISYRDDEHALARGYNSITVFPSLRHTGIKSNYEPVEIQSNSPDGRMTSSFKNVSVELMRKIYREEQALKSKEAPFKLSHRKEIESQFQTYNTLSSQRLSNLNTLRNNYTDQISTSISGSDFQLEKTSEIVLTKKKEKKRSANRLAYFNQLLESS